MAAPSNNEEPNPLLSSHLPCLSSSAVNSDHHYQYTPSICPSFLNTDFDVHLQSTSFQQGNDTQEKWGALAFHHEQSNNVATSSPFANFAVDNKHPIFARYGDPHCFTDVTSGSWNGKLSHLLACHNRDNGTPLSPFTHGYNSDHVSLLEMITNSSNNLAVHGGPSSMDDVLHLDYNLESNGCNAELAMDPSTRSLAIQNASNYAGQATLRSFPVDTMLADRAVKFSPLNKHSTMLQSAALQGAASQDGRDLAVDSKTSATQSILLKVSTELGTPPSLATNSPNGLESFQQTLMKDRHNVLNLAAGTANVDCHAMSNSNLVTVENPKMVASKKAPSLPTLVEIDGSECIGKPCNSFEESDGSMGAEISSDRNRENGWESASHARLPSKKRTKQSFKSNTMQLSDVKDLECDIIKDKRQKAGDDSNEDESSKKMESNDSDDSMPPSIKETCKPPETPKTDYIHVRARRGQATDSHSLAERIRREKISERMKFLQDLVPGCSKITGKALMLDEIINYVQSLQRQVEFLSMKLAAMNPKVDFNMDSLFRKEICQPQVPLQQPLMFSIDNQQPYTPLRQQSSQALLRVGGHGGVSRPLLNVHSIGGSDSALRGTLSAPLTSKEAFEHIVSQASQAWDDELQSLMQMSYSQGRSTTIH
ncbi:hypothetical protein L7F22_038296 [Adiantum nelumboides]|nr:hypothetical protein [Adiantum nelumboides]